MRRRILSFALSLAMCLTLLPSTASAAGTKKVVEVENYGVKITMDEFLKVETRPYVSMHYEVSGISDIEIYVVADNSTVTVEAMDGKKYYDGNLRDWENNMSDYAMYKADGGGWDPTGGYFRLHFSSALNPWEGPATAASYYHGIHLMSESGYAEMVPATQFRADGWAHAELRGAIAEQLVSIYNLNPCIVDYTQGMTRADFAETMVRLYCAMTGKVSSYLYEGLDVSYDHPFTDVNKYSVIGQAYNLGFVNGKSATTFDPDGTLTRQEAATMLSRVYTKVHGSIPNIANTGFADNKDVADWARSSVAFMSGKGVVNGVGDNRFAPTKTLSIQESIVMAYRMLEKLK